MKIHPSEQPPPWASLTTEEQTKATTNIAAMWDSFVHEDTHLLSSENCCPSCAKQVQFVRTVLVQP